MILHLVTDRRRLAPGCGDAEGLERLVTQARCAIHAGIDVIQLRERDLEAGALLVLAQQLVALSRGTATRIIVNDRADVALAAGAHGVHLPARSFAVNAARRLARRGFLIGRSVHDPLELGDAAGADYMIAGTVWPTASKSEGRHWLDAEGLAALAGRATVPVLAIGGVTMDRLPAVARSGAAGLAAIGFFIGDATDEGCQAFADRMDSARRLFDTSVPHS
jgi:thiamine-phosphate pyrophosphorylase